MSLCRVLGKIRKNKKNLGKNDENLKNNLIDKNTSFFHTIGAFPEALEKPEVDINFLAKSLDDAMEKARNNNPVTYVASNDIEAALQQYEQAKGSFYPSFSIEASQEWGDELNGSPGYTDEFSAMLKMRYNLYNGGSDKAKSRRAAYQINKSKDQSNKIRLKVNPKYSSFHKTEL